jgi:hypothetical protein
MTITGSTAGFLSVDQVIGQVGLIEQKFLRDLDCEESYCGETGKASYPEWLTPFLLDF